MVAFSLSFLFPHVLIFKNICPPLLHHSHPLAAPVVFLQHGGVTSGSPGWRWLTLGALVVFKFSGICLYASEQPCKYHFKNIMPTEILFRPQNLHRSSSHSLVPFLVVSLLPLSTVIGQSRVSLPDASKPAGVIVGLIAQRL